LFIDKIMNRHGQSIIEYMFIAVLIILGIVFMGPYVLRSINAHFKLWDENVQDSATENIAQAPANSVPYIPPNCTCTNTGSPPANCGVSPCAPNQYYTSHSCDPQGCDDAPPYSCITDNSCCSNWLDEGCGTLPAGSAQPVGNNCDYGYDIQVKECGTNNTVQCVYDAQPTGPCPLPTCLGIISAGSLFCATNTTSAPTNLTQSYGISYVVDQAACPPSPTCQLYCDSANSYFLNSSGTACLRTFTVAPDIDPCPGCRGKVVITTNPQSFSMCAGTGTVITAVSVVASPAGQSTTAPIVIPGGPGEDGCQNPNTSGQNEREPGDTCQITLTY
jgi:hypothetical protein